MITDFITAFRKWREDRHAIQALERLSDHQLHDIGLNRGNLEEAIRRGVRS